MLKGLFFLLGYLMVHLGYGQEAMETRKKLEVNKGDFLLSASFTIILIFWLLSLLLLSNGSAAKDTLWCMIMAISTPIVFLLWIFYARKSGKRYIEEYRKLELAQQEQERLERERLEAERAKAERLKMEEAQRLEYLQKAVQQMNTDVSGELAVFFTTATKCSSIGEVATLWKSLAMENNTLIDEISKRIEAATRMERLYGASSKEAQNLVAELRNLTQGKPAEE